jgi:hypothetical protein
LNERSHLEDLDVDGRMIKVFKIEWQNLDWMHLARDRENDRLLVNTVMNSLFK